MKIIKLLTRIDETGMTTNTLDLTEAYAKKGHQVYVIIGKRNYKNEGLSYIKKRFERSGAELIWFNNYSKSGLINKLSKFASVFTIMMRIVKINPDIIHSQSPYLSFVPWFLKRRFVSTIHVADLPLRWEYKNATKVIAISRETYHYGINHFKYKPEDIEMVYHGVSRRYSIPLKKEEIADLKSKYNIKSGNIVIGMVASIEYRKGHDLLIKAIKNLGSLNKQINLLLVGSYKSTKETNWLENLIENSGFKNQITVVPYQDPKPFYDMMDIFVLPSRLEGFPLVTLEAFLSGCCVIRSNVQGAYDQVTDNETGFIFKSEDAQALKNILESLITNENLRKKVAEKGRNFALENFTSDIMAENTLKVYQKTIDLK